MPARCMQAALVVLGLVATRPPRIGDLAPPLPAATPAGTKALVVEFYASWCEPCRESLPGLAAVVAAHAREGVRWVAVSEDADATAGPALLAAVGVRPDASAWDDHGQAGRAWGVTRLPTTFIVDGSGIVRHINRGTGRIAARRIDGWIRETLAAPLPPI